MSDTPIDQQIQAEIERLRLAFPGTQDLYREACVLLFFRFGITPTANKLYQFVRKGSMSAPSEALAKFWENLRQKSRVRIESPDLPEDLRAAAGELTAALWTKAQACAQAGFENFRAQAQAELGAVQSALAAEQAQALDLRKRLDEAAQAADRSGQRFRDLYSQLEAERTARSALEQSLTQARNEADETRQALEDTKRAFSAERDQIRATAELEKERLRESEQRALAEIERERSATARMQKYLETFRRSAQDAEERQRTELKALQTELGQVRQQLGTVEGAHTELQAARIQLLDELVSLRAAAQENAAARALAARESELALARIETLARENAALQLRLATAVRGKPSGVKAKLTRPRGKLTRTIEAKR